MQNNHHQSSESTENRPIEQTDIEDAQEMDVEDTEETGSTEETRKKEAGGTGKAEKKRERNAVNNKNKGNERNEKLSTYNAKGQRYAFLLLGVLCLALILSLFIGNKPDISSQAINASFDSSTSSTYQDNTPTFNDRLQNDRESYRTKESEELKNGWMRQMKHPDDVEPKDWQRQETVRVLNSRKSAFHFSYSIQPKERKTQDIKEQSSSSSQNNTQVVSTQMNPVGKGNLSTLTESEIKETIKADKKGLIPTGTVISAALDQDINSDYIGQWLGHTTHDVYNADQTFILMPKGTKLTGKTLHIANVNAPIQNRLGLTVEWAILPNGNRIDFKKADVSDQTGIHAVKDKVNRHLGWQLGGVAAYALLSSNTPQPNYYGQPEHMTFIDQFQMGVGEQAKPMINKYLSLVPTVIIRAGTALKIVVKDDLFVRTWSRTNQTIYR